MYIHFSSVYISLIHLRVRFSARIIMLVVSIITSGLTPNFQVEDPSSIPDLHF